MMVDARNADEKVRIMLAAVRVAAARLPMLETCRRIGQAICEEIGWDYVGVWVLEPADWNLRCADGWVRPGCVRAGSSFVEVVHALRLPPGTGLPGRAWATRKVQWVSVGDSARLDAGASEIGPEILPQAALAEGLRNGICLPVRYDEDVLALVEILGRTPRAPDEGMLEILDAIGIQLALTELRDSAELRSELAQRELEEAREQLESIMTCARPTSRPLVAMTGSCS